MTKKKAELIEVAPGDVQIGDEVIIMNVDLLPYTVRGLKGSNKGIVVGEYDWGDSFVIGFPSWKTPSGHDTASVRNSCSNIRTDLTEKFHYKMYYIETSEIKVVKRNGMRVSAPAPVKLVLSRRLIKVISDNADACKICKALSEAGIDNLVTQTRNYIQGNADGELTSMPYALSKPVMSNWKNDSRTYSSPWATIKPILSLNGISGIEQPDIEVFSNKITASFFSNLTFIERSDVSKVYCMPRVESGSLGDSCMNGDVDYLQLYDQSDNINVLTLVNDEGKLCGRALIWNLETEEYGNIVFLDRFYTAKYWMGEKFIQYATEKGYWYKENWDSYDCKTDWINPANGEEISMKVIASVPRLDYCDEYPYIDTFTFGNSGDRTVLANYKPTSWKHIDNYQQTDGCRDYNNTNYQYVDPNPPVVETVPNPEPTIQVPVSDLVDAFDFNPRPARYSAQARMYSMITGEDLGITLDGERVVTSELSNIPTSGSQDCITMYINGYYVSTDRSRAESYGGSHTRYTASITVDGVNLYTLVDYDMPEDGYERLASHVADCYRREVMSRSRHRHIIQEASLSNNWLASDDWPF